MFSFSFSQNPRKKKNTHNERKNVYIEPFSKSPHAFFQISPRFELGIRHRLDRDLGAQGMTDEGANVIGKSAECVVAALKKLMFDFSPSLSLKNPMLDLEKEMEWGSGAYVL